MPDAASAPAPRRTPYELVFRDGGLEDESLPAIAEESETRSVDATQPEQLLMLAESARTLRRMRPEGADGPPGSAVAEYGALLFHGFHFWESGHPLFVVGESDLVALLESPTEIGHWTLDPPSRSGYVQLPRHRLWLPMARGGTPEAVDGFFWTIGGGASPVLHVALITGVRPDRPGFGVVDVSAPLPPPPAAHFADIRGRDEGRDFENVLPGGEIDGLFALTSVAEALRLASLVLHAAAGQPGEPIVPSDDDRPRSPHELPATALAYRRISVAGADG